MKKKFTVNLSTLDMFLIISLTITGLFFLINIVTHGSIFQQTLAYSTEMETADFFLSEAFAAGLDKLYYIDPPNVCYPPLAYSLLWLVYRITPVYVSDNLDWEYLMNTNNQMTLYVMANIVMVIILVYGIAQFFKKTEFKYLVLLPVAVLFSYPFYGTSIQRGNIIFYPAVFTVLAYVWMDDDNPVKREMSSIMIAIAASFKLVPAVSGLSVLKRKDVWRIVRLVIYGILFFVVPFIFTGGLGEVIHYFQNMTIRNDNPVTMGSIKGMTMIALSIISKRIPVFSDAAIDSISSVVQILFLAASVVLSMITRKKDQEALFVMGIMACFLSVNFAYVLVYFLPSLLVFIKEIEKPSNVIEYFTLICYSLIFSIPFFFAKTQWGVEGACFMIVYLLIFANMISVVIDEIRNKKSVIASI